MDLEKLLRYFYDIIKIPIAVYKGEELILNCSSVKLESNPAHFFISRLRQNSSELMDVTLTKDCVICGYIENKKSKKLIEIGPVLEFPCSLSTAHNIIKDTKVSNEKADDLLHFFECHPCIPLTKFLKIMLFLNYIINEKEPTKNLTEDMLLSLLGPEIYPEKQRRHITLQEQQTGDQMLAYVEFGKTRELQQLLRNEKLLNGDTDMAANDSLRSIKNIFVTSIALVRKAAQFGGMDGETAIVAMDRYLQKMERINSYNEIIVLWRQMFLDFCSQVEKIRQLHESSKLVHRVSGYIHDHIYENIIVTDIAQELGYNRTYLSGMFKQKTGKNPKDYILEVKIEEAKLLLRTTKKPVIEIAVSLGFSSQSHFQTVFKKISGVTPLQYRMHN